MSDGPEVEFTGPTADGARTSEALLRRTISTLEHARPMPLSTSSIVNKEELIELIDDAIERLPDELRQARWLLKERDEFLVKARRESDDIIEVARRRAERMVERTEVVKAAESRARRIVEDAEADARRIRMQLEDFCDQKLRAFETMLDKTRAQVEAGRANLQPRTPTQAPEPKPETESPQGAFFDQDTSA